MGRRKYSAKIGIFVVMAILAGIGIYLHAQGIGEREVVADTAYFVDENGKIAVPPGGLTTEARMNRGNSEENPFFALEIVPYEGYAEFGYLIEGCEPIDFSVYSNRGNLPYYHRKQVIYSLDDIPRLMPEYEVGKEVRDANVEQFGIMTRVADGTGNYRQIPIQCEYTLGGEGGYSQKLQYGSGQIDENGDTMYYGDTSGVFVTFRYDTTTTDVMRYSPVINTKHEYSDYYKYYSMINGHWVYRGKSNNSNKKDYYIGAGTHHVVFVPDEFGDYVADRVLGSSTEGALKQIIDADVTLEWGELSVGLLQTALYNRETGYVYDAAGPYTRKVQKAKYEKVEAGSLGANYTYEPLSYDECKSMAEVTRESYRNALPEGTSFKVARSNVTYYAGYVHDNTFLRETLDLGYEMVNGVRTKITDEARVEERIANFHSVVYTVTPEDLNQNLDLIDRADIISISATNKVGSTIEMYKECRKEELFSRANTNLAKAVKNYYSSATNKATFSTNPLDWDAAMRIYKRVTALECTCPIIIDTVAYKSAGSGGNVASQKASISIPQTYGNGETRYQGGTGYSNNLYKLFLLLDQMKPAVFEALYGPLDGENFTVVNTGETDKDGSPIRTGMFTKWNVPESAPAAQKNATTYWNEDTFLPYELMPEYGQHKEILNTLGIMNSYGDTIYQYDSMGAQNMITGNLYVFPTNNLMTIEFSNMDANGLKNNQYGHEAYEYFDSVNGDEEGEPSNLGTAMSIHYIWRKSRSGANPSGDKTVRILELQPSSLYTKTDAAWAGLIANYSDAGVQVTVDRMTTGELNGKQVDLVSAYDLIYIGLNKDTSDVTMKFESGTDFLYAHTGPGVTLDDAELKGLLGQASVENRFVFSGNDITLGMKAQLLEFAKFGGPVLFGTGFYTTQSAGTAVAGVDRNSNLYALTEEIKANLQAQESHIYEGALAGSVSNHMAEATKFKTALQKDNVTLTMLEQPLEYDSGEEAYTDKYITSDMLRYRFKVNADSSEEYVVRVWIDQNKDGVFAAGEQTETEVYPVDAGGVQGARITDSKVTGGATYQVNSPLSDLTGGVHWKLELVQYNTVYASLSGVSAVRVGSRREIAVLQVVPDQVSSRTVYLPQEGEVTGSTVQIPGLTSVQKQTTKQIWDLAGALTEYKFRFVRMTKQEVAAAQAANENSLSGQYDMMVLGFAETGNDVYGASVQEAAEKFLNLGKTVIYTPDVLALPGEDNATGGYAKSLRKRFAVDRYGITSMDTGGKATGLIAAYTSGVTGDIVKAPNSSDSGGYITVSAGGTSYMPAQGLANGVLYRYRSGWTADITTTKVAKINKGVLTEYPYTCGDTLTVSSADAPFYQLEMEQANPVVWYCMSGNGNGTVSGTYLNRSQNDVRNHYYTYTSGNVFYTGIGKNAGLTADEGKLLINTLVAAYRETPDTVGVVIDNADAAKTGDTYYLCVDVDSGQKDKLMGSDCASSHFVWKNGHVEERNGESKKLYFRIKDDNILPAGTTAKYTLVFENESGGTYTEMPYAVYDTTGNPVTNLQANTSYYTFVKVKTELTATGPAIGQTLLRIYTKMQCYEGGTESYSSEDTKKVQIIPRGLFDLD
ncbi:MAG: DUF5057 domain-containing protein [Lachnospiraceae bacterium]|nr:DUF5057 domain-containing protein [Lachnospiraceae bacterium]